MHRKSKRNVTVSLKKRLAAFVKGKDGAVAIIVAFTLPVLLAVAGLALEYGQLLLVRSEAQRTADLASHAGASAYARTGSNSAMIDAAKGVARLNGFGDDEIVVALDLSFPTASGEAVRATITVTNRLFLPQLVGGDTTADVVVSSVAGAMGGQPACVQALNPDGTGITLTGSAGLQANACSVASNAAVTAPCGTSIITEMLSYDAGSDPLAQSCNTIQRPDGQPSSVVRRHTPDPLAGSEVALLAASRMASTAVLSPPDGVVVASGPDIVFGWNQTATIAQAASVGCSASFASSVSEWTFSCPGLSTVNLGNVTLEGGLRLRFNPGAPGDVTYNISGTIRNNGERMAFAGGAYNVAQGIVTGGGAVTEFGAGTYRIGQSTHHCSGARYSICNTSQLSFEGPSDFQLPGGVRNDGGALLTLGTGGGNSFRFGASSGGNAISVGGGSQTYMGDADGGQFEVSGWIDGGGGGSCLVIPAAERHEINGSIVASGAIRFGAGLYAINGYMHLGSNGGGSATCGGETISIEASNTTFLISGAGAGPGGWGCGGQAFCVSAGYNNLRITAPTSGPFTDVAIIGPLDPSIQAGATLTAGASGARVSGAFYFPNGRIALSGGASASSVGGGCLHLIGAEITLSDGTSVASECKLSGTGSAGQVVILG